MQNRAPILSGPPCPRQSPRGQSAWGGTAFILVAGVAPRVLRAIPGSRQAMIVEADRNLAKKERQLAAPIASLLDPVVKYRISAQ